jgi:hypothetical protein
MVAGFPLTPAPTRLSHATSAQNLSAVHRSSCGLVIQTVQKPDRQLAKQELDLMESYYLVARR